VDVGRGLLDVSLRSDPRVVLCEGVNARYLDDTIVPETIGIITVDVAFISVTKLLPALEPRMTPAGDMLVLVKPQFELGRGEVGRGVVTDPLKHLEAIVMVADAAQAHGLGTHGLVASPIRGARGNREFFVRLRPEPGWDASTRITRAREIAGLDTTRDSPARGP
jgi:23S rRNA (cytidine1920-2'-O)/16S rRNA (cytidine1409-2'-O)-methyltransferase